MLRSRVMDVCTVCNMCNVCGGWDRRAYWLSLEGKREKNTSTKEGKMNRVFCYGHSVRQNWRMVENVEKVGKG